jgi:hypothetical protein
LGFQGNHVFSWYIYTYIHIYVYIYVYIYIHIYIFIYICIYIYTYIYIYIYIYIGYWDSRETTFLADVDKTVETTYYDSVTGMYMYIFMCMYMYIRVTVICIYMYVYIHVFMDVFMFLADIEKTVETTYYDSVTGMCIEESSSRPNYISSPRADNFQRK